MSNSKWWSDVVNQLTQLPSLRLEFTLKSKKKRHANAITLVTQCSLDRVDRLWKQCEHWPSCVSAAVFLPVSSGMGMPGPLGSHPVHTARQLLTRVFDHAEASPEYAALDVTLVTMFAPDPWVALATYPINALRNVALAQATTDLVLLLDVDFLPCRNSMLRFLENSDLYLSIHRLCLNGRCAIVQPAFEPVQHPATALSAPLEEASLQHPADTDAQQFLSGFLPTTGPSGPSPVPARKASGAEPEAAVARDAGSRRLEQKRSHRLDRRSLLTGLLSGWKPKDGVVDANPALMELVERAVSGGKADVRAMAEQDLLRPFASVVFPAGHGPTDYPRWHAERCKYVVQYIDGYEPYVIVARSLVPWYDERFRGYGRNKVIHSFHMAALGFHFMVSPDSFVVAMPHPPSPAWKAALDNPTNRVPGAFHYIKQLYRQAQQEIRTGLVPSTGSTMLRPPQLWDHSVMGWWTDPKQSLVIRDRQRRNLKMKKLLKRIMGQDRFGLRTRRDRVALSRTLFELNFHYCPRHLVVRWDSTWGEPVRDPNAAITLVTICTPDRILRLRRAIKQWSGPVTAVVYWPTVYRLALRGVFRRLGALKYFLSNDIAQQLKLTHRQHPVRILIAGDDIPRICRSTLAFWAPRRPGALCTSHFHKLHRTRKLHWPSRVLGFPHGDDAADTPRSTDGLEQAMSAGLGDVGLDHVPALSKAVVGQMRRKMAERRLKRHLKEVCHLVPLNSLRNLAVDKADTELVFALDIDLVPSCGMHELLTAPGVMDQMLEECTLQRTAFVVPAFELVERPPVSADGQVLLGQGCDALGVLNSSLPHLGAIEEEGRWPNADDSLQPPPPDLPPGTQSPADPLRKRGSRHDDNDDDSEAELAVAEAEAARELNLATSLGLLPSASTGELSQAARGSFSGPGEVAEAGGPAVAVAEEAKANPDRDTAGESAGVEESVFADEAFAAWDGPVPPAVVQESAFKQAAHLPTAAAAPAAAAAHASDNPFLPWQSRRRGGAARRNSGSDGGEAHTPRTSPSSSPPSSARDRAVGGGGSGGGGNGEESAPPLHSLSHRSDDSWLSRPVADSAFGPIIAEEQPHSDVTTSEEEDAAPPVVPPRERMPPPRLMLHRVVTTMLPSRKPASQQLASPTVSGSLISTPSSGGETAPGQLAPSLTVPALPIVREGPLEAAGAGCGRAGRARPSVRTCDESVTNTSLCTGPSLQSTVSSGRPHARRGPMIRSRSGGGRVAHRARPLAATRTGGIDVHAERSVERAVSLRSVFAAIMAQPPPAKLPSGLPGQPVRGTSLPGEDAGSESPAHALLRPESDAGASKHAESEPAGSQHKLEATHTLSGLGGSAKRDRPVKATRRDWLGALRRKLCWDIMVPAAATNQKRSQGRRFTVTSADVKHVVQTGVAVLFPLLQLGLAAGFHTHHYPLGHGPTRPMAWLGATHLLVMMARQLQAETEADSSGASVLPQLPPAVASGLLAAGAAQRASGREAAAKDSEDGGGSQRDAENNGQASAAASITQDSVTSAGQASAAAPIAQDSVTSAGRSGSADAGRAGSWPVQEEEEGGLASSAASGASQSLPRQDAKPKREGSVKKGNLLSLPVRAAATGSNRLVGASVLVKAQLRKLKGRGVTVSCDPSNQDLWHVTPAAYRNFLLFSYEVEFQEGYEPFVIAAKSGLPRCDERFSGYGYDKVAWFMNIHASGMKLRVLPGVFVLDKPHLPSSDWAFTYGRLADPLQAPRVQGLYNKVRRELLLRKTNWPCTSGGAADAGDSAGLLPALLTNKGLPAMHISSTAATTSAASALEGTKLLWTSRFPVEFNRHRTAVAIAEDPEDQPCAAAARQGSKTMPWTAAGWDASSRRGLQNCELVCLEGAPILEESHPGSSGMLTPANTSSGLSPTAATRPPRKVPAVAAPERLHSPFELHDVGGGGDGDGGSAPQAAAGERAAPQQRLLLHEQHAASGSGTLGAASSTESRTLPRQPATIAIRSGAPPAPRAQDTAADAGTKAEDGGPMREWEEEAGEEEEGEEEEADRGLDWKEVAGMGEEVSREAMPDAGRRPMQNPRGLRRERRGEEALGERPHSALQQVADREAYVSGARRMELLASEGGGAPLTATQLEEIMASPSKHMLLMPNLQAPHRSLFSAGGRPVGGGSSSGAGSEQSVPLPALAGASGERAEQDSSDDSFSSQRGADVRTWWLNRPTAARRLRRHHAGHHSHSAEDLLVHDTAFRGSREATPMPDSPRRRGLQLRKLFSKVTTFRAGRGPAGGGAPAASPDSPCRSSGSEPGDAVDAQAVAQSHRQRRPTIGGRSRFVAKQQPVAEAVETEADAAETADVGAHDAPHTAVAAERSGSGLSSGASELEEGEDLLWLQPAAARARTPPSKEEGVGLRVHIARGTWSPSGCLAAGIAVGGVAMRQRLREGGLTRAVLRYMVRFPDSFPWAQGGTLPGLYCNAGSGLRVAFAWRLGGRGHIVVNAPQQKDAPSAARLVLSQHRLPGPQEWFLYRSQWLSLQMEVTLLDYHPGHPDADAQGLIHPQPRGRSSSSSISCNLTGSSAAVPPKPQRQVVHIRAWRDEELVAQSVVVLQAPEQSPQLRDSTGAESRIDSSSTNAMAGEDGTSGTVGASGAAAAAAPRQLLQGVDGVLMTCFFGGTSEDWACPEDTHIDFAAFQLYG